MGCPPYQINEFVAVIIFLVRARDALPNQTGPCGVGSYVPCSCRRLMNMAVQTIIKLNMRQSSLSTAQVFEYDDMESMSRDERKFA